MQVERCDWFNFLGATSTGHFSYLTARRLWLKTFIPDEAIEEVSISLPASTIQADITAHPISGGAQLQGAVSCIPPGHCLMADYPST